MKNGWISKDQIYIPEVRKKGFQSSVIIRNYIPPKEKIKSGYRVENREETTLLDETHQDEKMILLDETYPDEETVLLSDEYVDDEATVLLQEMPTAIMYIKHIRTNTIIKIDSDQFIIGKSSACDYMIEGNLQSGGGGVVYKAYHKRLKNYVILKKLKRRSANMRINRQEVDILKNLSHMYLPQVLDFLTVKGDIYTVMSFIPGKSFKELLDEKASFTQNQLIIWGMQLCSALHYLHSQNPPIIHGDIKPANIMLTPEGNICLIDFNISFYLDGNTVLGYSEGYASPEQYIIALDRKSSNTTLPKHSVIDEKSDIYSVGATFFHLITGYRLDEKRSFKSEEKRLLQENVSDAFVNVILKSIEVDRKKRYANAYELYQGFRNIHKKDKRYKQLLTSQWIIRGGLVLCLAVSIVLEGYGIHTLKLEKVDKYNHIVEKQVKYREAQNYEEENAEYENAVKLIPSNIESYYQNACTLYELEEYEKCIEFIDYDIFQNEKLSQNEDRLAEIYYLKAESYFELENYGESVKAFEQLIGIGGDEAVYYRDYAIALAYNEEMDQAQKVLEKALDHGLEEESIYYAKGEIDKALGEWGNAIEEFKDCISISEDNKLKMRSYVLISDIYEKQGDLSGKRQILLEAQNNLPVENQLLILERLVQTDIDLAENGQTDLRNEAIETSCKIIDQGWETYTTYNNLAILYQKQGDLENAKNILNTMITNYGDDYNIEKRFAFLEIDQQEMKANEERDYSAFLEYYEKAEKMYYDQLKNNDSDEEMQLLENVYQQVENGGWVN